MKQKRAIIIGAGPAGLTAAYELMSRTDIQPIIYETTDMVGGIARTSLYKNNRIDLGGHRFFSKSARVTEWWLSKFPLQHIENTIKEQVKIIVGDIQSSYLESDLDPEKNSRIMLVRKRLSRILFRRRFFDYPVSLSFATLRNLGFLRVVRVGLSYIRAKLFPIRHETSLEDFFINRFGRELYKTFFKYYTEKVWGISCRAIKPDWGAQRIKGLSIIKILSHAMRSLVRKNKSNQKIETSLVEYYLYPKYGPGQLWEVIANFIKKGTGEIHLNQNVIGLSWQNKNITGVIVQDQVTGEVKNANADYVFSTMPVKDLVAGMGNDVPADVRQTAEQLQYRDFLTIGLLFSRLKTPSGSLPDNWIYVQEEDVKVGRIQIFNNWSPYLVENPDTIWLGLEYFCQEGDELWSMNNQDLIHLGINELTSLGLADPKNYLDGVVLRMPKAYPAYFGGYERFQLIRDYVDQFENLFLIGRNGMHRYNNMDHSMLTAMTAVDNIMSGATTKENLWKVNTETDYHEGK
jgi:protoporphyrinogen oxidase